MVDSLVTLNTLAPSPTASLIYSDFQYKKEEEGLIAPAQNTFARGLRGWSLNPLGVLGAGVVRLVLSLLHILYHTLRALSPFNDEGHSYHVIKGIAELLHSIIELIPIVGYCFNKHYYSVGHQKKQDFAFLVRLTHEQEIYNPL